MLGQSEDAVKDGFDEYIPEVRKLNVKGQSGGGRAYVERFRLRKAVGKRIDTAIAGDTMIDRKMESATTAQHECLACELHRISGEVDALLKVFENYERQTGENFS